MYANRVPQQIQAAWFALMSPHTLTELIATLAWLDMGFPIEYGVVYSAPLGVRPAMQSLRVWVMPVEPVFHLQIAEQTDWYAVNVQQILLSV
jgi:hypothetical protein